jgi:hypothetical protein
MTESRLSQDEEGLMHAWQQTAIGGTDPARLASEIAAKVNRFDRMIRWRNLREYAGGTFLLISSGYGARHGSGPAVLTMIGASFVMGYLWWTHRRLRPLDSSTDARSYQTAMLKRYEDQIRLLSGIKYWYLLPLYIPLVWGTAERWSRNPRGALIGLLLMTALFAFVGWLNESYAVRRLREARARTEQMFNQRES